MKKLHLELTLTPSEAADPEKIRSLCARKLKISNPHFEVCPTRRSIDARRGSPKVHLTVEVWPSGPPPREPRLLDRLPDRLHRRVLIVGAGPAGYFCALELLFHGIKPIVLERGKDTRARRYDLRAIMQFDRVNPDSNYCFGEGGAGTYSDGKLYTRSGKRGEIGRVLKLLVEHGARPEILVDTHPHIGSNKLPYVVENLRQTILDAGGEIHFNARVTDLVLARDSVRGVVLGEGPTVETGDAVVLATGHSARDIFELLQRKGLQVESKPFALGLRVEHPQPLIDEIQYRQNPRDEYLPAASYRLAKDGVYSFCMCPGGLIVPAATAPGEIVVNGMSMSKRNSRWANSGIVTSVENEDVAPLLHEFGPLAGLEFQRRIERAAFAANQDDSQKAPAQLLLDFLEDRQSQDLPRTSYIPGVVSTRLSQVLPERITTALMAGFRRFGETMPRFLSDDAVVVGVESRTSSPVKIPRKGDQLSHPQVPNLFPCGEGAGYAGGIVSAAMDGQRVAQQVAVHLSQSSPT